MFSTADTIVALATPRGRSAIGVVRLSGKDAHRIAAALLNRPGPLSPRLATLCHLAANVSIDPLMEDTRDEVLATSFPAPASYTGEDMVEISCHGNPVMVSMRSSSVLRGQEPGWPGPGEFTLRAFLNGKRDLVRAEAVADLIAAATPPAGTSRIRSARGDADTPHHGARCHVVRSHYSTRGLARLP